LASLETAAERLADGNTANDQAACNTLDTFTGKVETDAAKGRIDPAEAVDLLEAVEAIKNAAGC